MEPDGAFPLCALGAFLVCFVVKTETAKVAMDAKNQRVYWEIIETKAELKLCFPLEYGASAPFSTGRLSGNCWIIFPRLHDAKTSQWGVSDNNHNHKKRR